MNIVFVWFCFLPFARCFFQCFSNNGLVLFCSCRFNPFSLLVDANVFALDVLFKLSNNNIFVSSISEHKATLIIIIYLMVNVCVCVREIKNSFCVWLH